MKKILSLMTVIGIASLLAAAPLMAQEHAGEQGTVPTSQMHKPMHRHHHAVKHHHHVKSHKRIKAEESHS